MRLATLMKSNVLFVSPYDSLDKAICLMDEHAIHHLPVVDTGRLVGMISDRDLLLAVGWKLECERKPGRQGGMAGPSRVREIMTTPAIHLEADAALHTAARMMATGKFHALPIVSGQRLIGIVTSNDILQQFIERTHLTSHSPLLHEPVARHMRVKLITVGPTEVLNTAVKKMRDANIRHLPVVVDNQVIGIVSDRDLRRSCGVGMIEDEIAEATGAFYIGSTEVLEIMSRDVLTIDEHATMMTAVRTMGDERIGCLPVMRGNHFAGLLTDTDLLHLIAEIDDDG